MPVMLAWIISEKYATMAELQTIYDYRDALDMVEIITVDKINQRILSGPDNG